MNTERRKRVEARAYEIWQREGCPAGKSEEHWRLALDEIAAQEDAEAGAVKAKKAEPKKKSEKSKPEAHAKKTIGAAAAKKDTPGAGKKSAVKTKTGSGGKAKKSAK